MNMVNICIAYRKIKSKSLRQEVLGNDILSAWVRQEMTAIVTCESLF